jgi:hypothetical protein
MATGFGHCVPSTRHTDATGASPCDALVSVLDSNGFSESTPKRWSWVMRTLRGKIPETQPATDYCDTKLRFIAQTVADAFFGSRFLQVLRQEFHWRIVMERKVPESQLTQMNGAGATGKVKGTEYLTFITGPLVDKFINAGRPVYNDGFLVRISGFFFSPTGPRK